MKDEATKEKSTIKKILKVLETILTIIAVFIAIILVFLVVFCRISQRLLYYSRYFQVCQAFFAIFFVFSQIIFLRNKKSRIEAIFLDKKIFWSFDFKIKLSHHWLIPQNMIQYKRYVYHKIPQGRHYIILYRRSLPWKN